MRAEDVHGLFERRQRSGQIEGRAMKPRELVQRRSHLAHCRTSPLSGVLRQPGSRSLYVQRGSPKISCDLGPAGGRQLPPRPSGASQPCQRDEPRAKADEGCVPHVPILVLHPSSVRLPVTAWTVRNGTVASTVVPA